MLRGPQLMVARKQSVTVINTSLCLSLCLFPGTVCDPEILFVRTILCLPGLCGRQRSRGHSYPVSFTMKLLNLRTCNSINLTRAVPATAKSCYMGSNFPYKSTEHTACAKA